MPDPIRDAVEQGVSVKYHRLCVEWDAVCSALGLSEDTDKSWVQKAEEKAREWSDIEDRAARMELLIAPDESDFDRARKGCQACAGTGIWPVQLEHMARHDVPCFTCTRVATLIAAAREEGRDAERERLWVFIDDWDSPFGDVETTPSVVVGQLMVAIEQWWDKTAAIRTGEQ